MPVSRHHFSSVEQYGTGSRECARRFTHEHHTTYQLHGNDGRVVMDVQPECVQDVSVHCARTGTGYVGVRHVRLDSIPDVLAAFMASRK